MDILHAIGTGLLGSLFSYWLFGDRLLGFSTYDKTPKEIETRRILFSLLVGLSIFFIRL